MCESERGKIRKTGYRLLLVKDIEVTVVAARTACWGLWTRADAHANGVGCRALPGTEGKRDVSMLVQAIPVGHETLQTSPFFFFTLLLRSERLDALVGAQSRLPGQRAY